jgi:predicted porin
MAKLTKLQASGSSKTERTNKDLDNPNVPKYKNIVNSKGAGGSATIDFGKLNLNLGGEYSKTKLKESLPGNKFKIPDNKMKSIYRSVTAGVGYDVTPDKNLYMNISKSKLKEMGSSSSTKLPNRLSVGLTGKFKGGQFVLEATKAGGEKIGRASFKIPFAKGGLVKKK